MLTASLSFVWVELLDLGLNLNTIKFVLCFSIKCVHHVIKDSILNAYYFYISLGFNILNQRFYCWYLLIIQIYFVIILYFFIALIVYLYLLLIKS